MLQGMLQEKFRVTPPQVAVSVYQLLQLLSWLFKL